MKRRLQMVRGTTTPFAQRADRIGPIGLWVIFSGLTACTLELPADVGSPDGSTGAGLTNNDASARDNGLINGDGSSNSVDGDMSGEGKPDAGSDASRECVADCLCTPGNMEACGSNVGACQAGLRLCGTDGIWGPCDDVGPVNETCNDLDDDCDGQVDEELVRACGEQVGACQPGRQSCDAGTWAECMDDAPASTETCNGLDDDCDGRVDEDSPTRETTCGVGACAAVGNETCEDGRLADDCRPGVERAETCDAVDNDCDGRVDEALVRACGQNIGACQPGRETCEDGRWGACQMEVGGSPELCNALDDDCDGQTDEDIESTDITCGRGACRRDGLRVCEGGAFSNNCTPGVANNEDCDGVDNDCDGSIDETFDLQRSVDRCGVCNAPCVVPNAVPRCRDGRCRIDDCRDGYGDANDEDADGCECAHSNGGNEQCDGVDNDCDGDIDEGIGAVNTTCGTGECASAGRAYLPRRRLGR